MAKHSTDSNGLDDVKSQQHRGFGTRVQHALVRLAPRSWAGPRRQTDGVSCNANKQRHQRRHSGDLELSARHSTSSIGTDAGDAALPDPSALAATAADTSRPQTGSISHISSSGSLGAVTNDANSVASGSNALINRHLTTAHAAAGMHGAAAAGDDSCSVATQAGSAAHSFTSLHSMMTHGDVSSDGGIPAYPAAAAAGPNDRAAAAGLSTSPTAGTSALSLLSAYRSSDAGGDATSVSTLPLISEAGYDERLLDVQTLTEEQDGEVNRREVSSETGPEPGSEHKGRISSSHGSYTSLTSNTSELSGLGPSAARLPSPAHTRLAHGQRSGSRHSFQQQLQQQLLQDLEETQEEGGGISGGLPLPFSTRRRPDNDDMCSYATQAGSSVHSLSSVMSHLENTQSQRPQWSSDGNAALHASGSNRSFSSMQPSRSRRSSAETPGLTAAASPAHFAGGPSTATSTVTDYGSGPSSPSAGQSTAGPFEQAPSLQRKNSLKGALRAVSRWGSGISQRLQRVGSGGAQQHIQQQQPQQQHSKRASEARNGSSPSAAAASSGQELVAIRRAASQ